MKPIFGVEVVSFIGFLLSPVLTNVISDSLKFLFW